MMHKNFNFAQGPSVLLVMHFYQTCKQADMNTKTRTDEEPRQCHILFQDKEADLIFLIRKLGKI
jgi:hypothetical protein